MGAIDVGPGATDRAGSYDGSATVVCVTNTANDSGTLTSFEVWANTNIASGFKMGTFSGSGTSYDDRDYETIGAVTAGSKQTFSGLNCTVVTGDFIGAYWPYGGKLEAASSGGGGIYYYALSDRFGQGSGTYTSQAGYEVSIYATGATPGWANISKVNGIASSSISKVNGIVVASIAKINGVAV